MSPVKYAQARVAAALALGRGHVIPDMFRALLERIGIGEADAPRFHVYLHRHVHLDGDLHGPMALKLVNALCGDCQLRISEAEAAAHEPVRARLRFWDAVLQRLKQRVARKPRKPAGVGGEYLTKVVGYFRFHPTQESGSPLQSVPDRSAGCAGFTTPARPGNTRCFRKTAEDTSMSTLASFVSKLRRLGHDTLKWLLSAASAVVTLGLVIVLETA